MFVSNKACDFITSSADTWAERVRSSLSSATQRTTLFGSAEMESGWKSKFNSHSGTGISKLQSEGLIYKKKMNEICLYMNDRYHHLSLLGSNEKRGAGPFSPRERRAH